MPHRTEPEDSASLPKGIKYIIGNEAAERFSFYGMKTILVVFMTEHLVNSSGALAVMGDEEAKGWYHLWSALVYSTPLLGAVLADWVFGKYRTIILLSLVYCLGHFTLALDETRLGLGLGLALIALGAGGIKPCVSAHVGDQFGARNANLIEKVFGWFYIAINLGSFVSTLLTPVLLDVYGPGVAFGVPGILMAIATFAFWMGRKVFVHIPPVGVGRFFIRGRGAEDAPALIERAFHGLYITAHLGVLAALLCAPLIGGHWGWQVAVAILVGFVLAVVGVRTAAQSTFRHALPPGGDYFKELVTGVGPRTLGQLVVLYLFVAVFWALFDQTGSAWVLQARFMDLEVAGITILPSQAQAMNPFMILLFVPISAFIVYPLIDRVWKLTPLRKIGIGLFVAVPSFLIPAYVENQIPPELLMFADFHIPFLEAPLHAFELPSIGWHVLAYALITAAEVLISITCLEFSYTQAPKRMKSLVMGLYFFGSVALGNLFTSAVNFYIENNDAVSLEGANYYLFFAGLMLASAVLFVAVSPFYRGQTYIQGTDPA